MCHPRWRTTLVFKFVFEFEVRFLGPFKLFAIVSIYTFGVNRQSLRFVNVVRINEFELDAGSSFQSMNVKPAKSVVVVKSGE